MSSTGTARKNSTIAPLIPRTTGDRDSRPTPNTAPKMLAVTIEMPAALSVSTRPGSRKFSQAREPTNGFTDSRRADPWLLRPE